MCCFGFTCIDGFVPVRSERKREAKRREARRSIETLPAGQRAGIGGEAMGPYATGPEFAGTALCGALTNILFGASAGKKRGKSK